MIKYNHACTIAFEVVSDDPNGADITSAMLRAALASRLDRIALHKAATGYDELPEACLPPYDTFEVR